MLLPGLPFCNCGSEPEAKLCDGCFKLHETACRYWYFDSVAEISQKLGITESKTKSILFRLRNSLRLYLEKEGYEL